MLLTYVIFEDLQMLLMSLGIPLGMMETDSRWTLSV